MYEQDSFFTLSLAGQIGLVLVTLALAGCLFLAQRWAFHRLAALSPLTAFVSRGLVTLALFWAFLWLSPQVYYLYYLAIFEGLPWQVVIGAPPALFEVVRLLAFSAEPTLSAHGKGLLGWGLLLYAALSDRARDR